ncbi:MAG: PLP-dependent aminotransferase family protein [Halopseudomonas aestusnigri]
MTKQPFLYEKVATFVDALIEDGTLQPGDRAPSLREIMRTQHVSLATATLAYQQLEDRGLIEPIPQSGYYVCERLTSRLLEPDQTNPPQVSRSVSIGKPIIRLLNYASDPTLQPLGCAIPSAALLSAGKLDRILAQKARREGDKYNIYSTPQGDLDLRSELAKRTRRFGQNVNLNDIAITNGCTEALTLALKCTTKPGDTVAIESPTYFGMLQVLEILGLKAFELPTSKDGINLDALASALTQKKITACLVASSFNNPLGCTLPLAQKHQLITLLDAHAIPLIEDDIYGDIHFSDERPKSFLSLAPEANILYCSSFSKSLAPGYRVGWVCAPRYIEAITEAKFALSLCCPTLPQAALAAYLASGGYDRHLQRLRRSLQKNVERTRYAIEEIFPAGTKVSRPSGGFVLWLELAPHIDSGSLFEQAIQQGICFAPGNLFSTTNNYDNCIRISCGYEWSKSLELAVIELGELVSSTR